MAKICIKNFLNDNVLLPWQPSLDYKSLHAFTAHLQTSKLDKISIIQWTALSRTYFHFAPDTSRVYFDTYVQYVGVNEGLGLMELVLMLYNQLSSAYEPIHISIPEIKHAHAQFPSSLVSGRRILTAFWRETSLKWMQLIYILVGNGKILHLKDLHILDSFLVGMESRPKSTSTKAQTSSPPPLFSSLLHKFFSPSVSAPIENIAKWIAVALDSNPSYSILNLSPHGLCTSQTHIGMPSNDGTLFLTQFSSRENQTRSSSRRISPISIYSSTNARMHPYTSSAHSRTSRSRNAPKYKSMQSWLDPS
jgi:hypothetical protein